MLCIFSFSGIGCGDPILPKNTEIERSENKAIISCTGTNQKWELNCRDGQWVGETGKCADGKSLILFITSYVCLKVKSNFKIIILLK